MAAQLLTLHMPDALYRRLRARAERTRRSIEAEVLDVLADAVLDDDDLSPDLAAAIEPLALLDDAALWRAARSHLPPDLAAQLESLHLKRQREGLTGQEGQVAATLTRQYERMMLVRAEAARLLIARGQDVSALPAGR